MNKEILDFILKESKKRLKSSLDCSESLDRKSIFIIGYFLTVISVSAVYIFSNIDNNVLSFPAGFYFFSNLVLVCIALEKIMPLRYSPLGNEPIKLLKDEVCYGDYKKVIVAYLHTLQGQIINNLIQNKAKAKNIRMCVFLAIVIVGVSAIIFGLNYIY